MQNIVTSSSSNLLSAYSESIDYSDSESEIDEFKIKSLSSAISSFSSLIMPEIPKEPSVLTRILMYVFGFLAIVCLFDDDTFGWSFVWAVVWFLCYISYNGDIQRRNDFIDLYR